MSAPPQSGVACCVSAEMEPGGTQPKGRRMVIGRAKSSLLLLFLAIHHGTRST